MTAQNTFGTSAPPAEGQLVQQSMTILSALAFVLGLVWVVVWFAKRYGVIAARPRARVAIEVVQRISMGPKTALAVVRVGEKVMAVSMGPDGMRPLFELDESDRQRIIASSETAIPLPSSVAAANLFQRETFVAPASFADTMHSALTTNSSKTNAPPQEIPAGERDFRNMLNMTMSAATRIAVFGGIALLSVLNAPNNANAQATPPVVPPATATAAPATAAPLPTPTAAAPTTVSPTVPTTVPTAQNAAQPATPSASPSATVPTAPAVIVPNTPVATPPAFVVPPGAGRTARPASVRAASTQPAGTASPNTTAGAAQNGSKTAEQIVAQRKSADSIKASASAKAPAKILAGSASRGANRTNSAPAAPVAGADEALANMLPQMDLKMGDGKDGGLRLSGTVGIVVMMGLLTLVPTLVLMMTGFTRILIVLHFLKQAMGTQSAPPAQLLAAMALLLTGFVMAPTFAEVNRTALEPWMDGKMTQVEMLKEGVKPMRTFMLKQTKEPDLRTFLELSRLPRPNGVDDVPLHVLTSAFVASELRRAFQIGFMIYLPFIIIDAVVASVLMSMGMFMLPPAMISMPFKLLLFVLVDGWGLIITGLVKSFVQ